jgi:hypothetical protein
LPPHSESCRYALTCSMPALPMSQISQEAETAGGHRWQGEDRESETDGPDGGSRGREREGRRMGRSRRTTNRPVLEVTFISYRPTGTVVEFTPSEQM